jgi:hypothetical protein
MALTTLPCATALACDHLWQCVRFRIIGVNSIRPLWRRLVAEKILPVDMALTTLPEMLNDVRYRAGM